MQTATALTQHPRGRELAVSHTGDVVVTRTDNGVEVFGERLANPVELDGQIFDFQFSSSFLWATSPGVLNAFSTAGRKLASAQLEASTLWVTPTEEGVLAQDGSSACLIEKGPEGLSVIRLPALDWQLVGWLGGLRTLHANGRELRVTDGDRVLNQFHLGGPGEIARGVSLFKGAAFAIVSRHASGLSIDVLKLPGRRIKRVELPDARTISIASDTGKAIATTKDGSLVPVDLRMGHVSKAVRAPLADCQVEIDCAGENVAVVGLSSRRCSVFIVSYPDLVGGLDLSRSRKTPMDEIACRFDLTEREADLLLVVATLAISARTRELAEIAGGMDLSLLCDIARIIDPHFDARELFDHDGAVERTSLLVGNAESLAPHPAFAELLEHAPGALEQVEIERYRFGQQSWTRIEEAVEHASPRFVLRGRPKRGRRALARFVAAAANNRVRVIESGEDLAERLGGARIRGEIPCVIDATPEARDVLTKHEGPIIAIVDEGAQSPLEAGASVVELPRLTEAERWALWRELTGCEQTAQELAYRFELPAELILELGAKALNLASISSAVTDRFAESLRGLAERVDHLPSRDEVILPDEIADSLCELVGREKARRLVSDDWGMASAMRSARGTIALFAGPPGTGKTLSAGLIASELGRELYRVDISKIVSKWIGETEKHLAKIFDAAEQTRAVLLFDEADSLFAKRSSVNSSNDRYANLEVNYLLGRLDSFTGFAILTTNHGTNIDPAFRRRLTANIAFPLPCPNTRVRLWEAHLPRAEFRSDCINLERLANDYPLSGGLIRNIALRAVFLAAAGERRLTQRDLERAIRSEYLDRGRLAPTGRLD